jgi:hypothetical protein
MRDVAVIAWRFALLGTLVVVAGFGAVVAAAIQGMALVPGGSILDGYDIGLLPWMEVGTWLVPIGGLVATVGGLAAIWLGRTHPVVRVATVPVLVVVLFWLLLVVIHTAPRPAIDGRTSTSSLADFVYSSPANTIVFLLIPAALVVLLAAVARRRTP